MPYRRSSLIALAGVTLLSVHLASCGRDEQPAPDAAPTGSLRPIVLRTDGTGDFNYTDKLRGMWFGQCLGNMTGLTTEGLRQGLNPGPDGRPDPPFFTEADWGTQPDPTRDPIGFRFLDVWPGDDDTDIEYMHLHLMAKHNTIWLTPEQVADGWVTHVHDQVWGSNRAAMELMRRGVMPPQTSTPKVNYGFLFIDAQLTTEMFGALCPGMPGLALRVSELPIRTVAGSHAAHAAQFYIVLYSLAPYADQFPSRHDAILWMVEEARKFIPDESKAADIADFVLADYRANPDKGDWAATRDRIYRRYQLNAGENGFFYFGWFESSVNFATGLMALLYGEGDLLRTIRIGTLAGWDSDNGTATMGGLIGLMAGMEALRTELDRTHLSERYWISATRENFPDHLPEDPQAEDTFTLMSQRMMPLVSMALHEGGAQSLDNGTSLSIPLYTPDAIDHRQDNPLWRHTARSANNQIRRAGGTVNVTSSIQADPMVDEITTTNETRFIADGLELDFTGADISEWPRSYSTWRAEAPDPNPVIEVRYSSPVPAEAVMFVEGDHLPDRGGWFERLELNMLVDGSWKDMTESVRMSEPLDPSRPYQRIDLVLPRLVMIEALRLTGTAGGPEQFVTVSGIDVLGPWDDQSDGKDD